MHSEMQCQCGPALARGRILTVPPFGVPPLGGQRVEHASGRLKAELQTMPLARFLLVLLLFLWPPGRDALGAEVDKAKELVYKVQAAFLKNFGDFTVWPQGAFTNASAPFVLGVFGNDQFAEVAQREFKDE